METETLKVWSGMCIEFVEYPKTPRLNREVVITEKLDGTNAQILIVPRVATNPELPLDTGAYAFMSVDYAGVDYVMLAGSRSRWLTNKEDNYGFGKWVSANRAELVKLGPGRHFGEWWGQGIQRNYGLKEKRFSLFNAGRWTGRVVVDTQTIVPGVVELDSQGLIVSEGPDCCHVVPVFWRGVFDNFDVRMALADLRERGSWAVPGYRNPEGIIIYHTAAKQCFKVLLENDELPKTRPVLVPSRQLDDSDWPAYSSSGGCEVSE